LDLFKPDSFDLTTTEDTQNPTAKQHCSNSNFDPALPRRRVATVRTAPAYRLARRIEAASARVSEKPMKDLSEWL
jgi:hypothetical protein